MSSTTTVHGKAAFDFVSSSDCEQKVTEPTHVDEGVPDLVLTVFMILLTIGLVRQLGPQIIVPFS